MYFKFSILLLTCLILAESALIIDEDDILHYAYLDAKYKFQVSLGRGLKASEMVTYFGLNNVSELNEIANSVYLTNLGDNIRLEQFKLIALEFSKRNGISIMDIAFPEESLQAVPSN